MGELRHASVCLRFFGDDLEPAALSRRLGVLPTHSWRLGELWSNHGVGQLRDTGARIIDGRWDLLLDINDQIADILDSLSKDSRLWALLTSSLFADMYCGMFLAQYTGSSGLSAQTLKLLSDRYLCLNLKIYQQDNGSGSAVRFRR